MNADRTQVSAFTCPESLSISMRRRVLARLREYFDAGFRDPELLYLGARYAVSLANEREARRFLTPLESMLCPDGAPCAAYAAVGLLELAIPSDVEKRQAVEERLERLAAADPDLKRLLSDIRCGQPGSPQAVLQAFERDADGRRSELEQALFGPDGKGASAKTGPLTKVQGLAEQAASAYTMNRLGAARYALETILLQDGDQPDVVRDLLTVTGEQQDVEAYERYWYRYVKLQLWRIARGDGVECAWDELIRFYSQVAVATDRSLDRPLNDLAAILPQPGLLSRWLESHAALAWLDAAGKARRAWQTGLDAAALARGQQGYLALMKYWYRLFYPEFLDWLDTGAQLDTAPVVPLPSGESAVRLVFSPVPRMVCRYLEWHRVGFGLKDDDGPSQERHRTTVAALAGIMVRLPFEYYTRDKELQDGLTAAGDLESKTLRQLLQEACSYPLYSVKLSKLLQAGDWQGIVTEFGEPDMEDRLNGTLRLFLALALSRLDRPSDALRLACRTIPDMPAAELKDDTQTRQLWDEVLKANIHLAIEAKSGGSATGPAPAADSPVFDATASQAALRDIKKTIESISGSGHVAAFRMAALAQADALYTEQAQVRAVIQKTQELVKKGAFDQARKEVKVLPNTPEELKQLKTSLLEQILEAEQAHKLNKLVEDTVSRVQHLVGSGQYWDAKQEIRKLPDTPAELQKLKADLLQQVASVEGQAMEHQRIQRQVDAVIEEVKRYVQNGNFSSARTAVNGLPAYPSELNELKRNLLSQIANAERQYQQTRQQVSRDSAAILERLSRRNIDLTAIPRIAKDNNIDIADPVQFYQLLKAIEEHLG